MISGRSSAYPEVYAALRHDEAVQERLDRIVALGASIGRLKHALLVRGLASSPAARMTVDPPAPEVAAAIAAEVAAAAGLAESLTRSLPSRASTDRRGGASSCVEVRRKRGAGPLQLGRRKPSGGPGESGAPGSGPARAGRRTPQSFRLRSSRDQSSAPKYLVSAGD